MKNLLSITLMALFSAGAMAQECSLDMEKSAPSTRYVANDNGTFSDELTGLTWMRCQLGKTWDTKTLACSGPVETYHWQSALSMVESINDQSGSHALHQFSGVKEWRMPNIKELVSLKEVACHSPAINHKVFDDTFNVEAGNLASFIWSSTPASDGQSVMTFDSINGEVYQYNAAQYKFSVLLVAE